MALRWYTVQECHPLRGWQDLGVFSKTEKPANDWAKTHTEKTFKATRTIRKPVGWSPDKEGKIL